MPAPHPSPWRAEARASLALALPLVATNAAGLAFNTTDVLLFGRLGADALAAGALASNLHFALLVFGVGLVSGVSPLVAIELGRHRHAVREVRRSVRQGFWAAGAVSLPIMLALWWGEALLLALGQEAGLARDAGGFLRALLWSVPSFLGFLVLRSFLASLQRPAPALVVSALAVGLNGALAYGLVLGRLGLPALGMAGAGIATALASLFMLLALAGHCATERRLRRYRLFGRLWRPDGARWRALWRLGGPIGAMMAVEVLVFNAAALVMGLIGALELAAHAVALQIAGLAFMVPLGIGQAATVRVGLAHGAGDAAGARLAGWTALGLGAAFALATMALMLLAPRALIGAFLSLDDPGNAALVALTAGFLALAGVFQLADALQAVAAGALRGTGDARAPLLLALAGYWLVGAPLALGLAFGAGLRGTGVWIGLAVGLATVAGLLLARWARRGGPPSRLGEPAPSGASAGG